jgi:hypothetical protein
MVGTRSGEADRATLAGVPEGSPHGSLAAEPTRTDPEDAPAAASASPDAASAPFAAASREVAAEDGDAGEPAAPAAAAEEGAAADACPERQLNSPTRSGRVASPLWEVRAASRPLRRCLSCSLFSPRSCAAPRAQVMKEHQKEGVRWLWEAYLRGGGLLTDEPGLGKTLQVIALVEALVRMDRPVARVLIACPANMCARVRSPFPSRLLLPALWRLDHAHTGRAHAHARRSRVARRLAVSRTGKRSLPAGWAARSTS